jgi:hypothetical protein
VNEERMKVRTSITTNRHESGENMDLSDGNTYIVGEARPPHNDKDPGFIKNRDVSVLMNPGTVSVQLYKPTANRTHQ